jgi:tRNA threonylcarbamoyladenosine biosynthesis protein TsaB
MIIAFDTSTAYAGVALFREDGLLAECNWRAHRDQTTQLLPMTQKLLESQNLKPDAITGVAVALGPGSFNGLRVGVSTAKGMALALGLPLYGVSSLDMLAYQHSYLNGNLCTIIEAGRGRLGIGFYKVKNGKWNRQGDYENVTASELATKISAPTFIAGELTVAQLQELESLTGKNVQILPTAASLRRAGYLAEMSWLRLKQGDMGEDIADLQPIYLHQPVKQ